MDLIIKFRMVCDENENFVRDYEVNAAMTLLELNDFICADLGYDTEEMTTFFLADNRWRKLKEYTAVDMGYGDEADENAPQPMENTHLWQVIHSADDRLIWVFDMLADRAYFLEVVDAEDVEKDDKCPLVRFSHGKPLDQYDADGDGGGEKSIFEEMMDDFSDFGGDDSYDDEY